MKTLQVSRFKAHCLGLLKEVRDTGEPLVLTLRGRTLAVVQPPGQDDPQRRETVAETLDRLQPLLFSEEGEFAPPPRDAMRPSARTPLNDED